MKAKFYLVVNRKGVVRMAKRKCPGLYQWERLVTLTIEVPDSVFAMPAMKATIDIPEGHVGAPEASVQSQESGG